MRVVAITESICPHQKAASPWVLYAQCLKAEGIDIGVYEATDSYPWQQRWDAMIFQAWHDCGNQRFQPDRIMRAFEKYATYRAVFPSAIQVACNHSDMSRTPLVIPYWRMGDPILYRTPPYDRSELHPLPACDVHAYELSYRMTCGAACFRQTSHPEYDAGVICSPSGPVGYRQAVAAAVSKVGYGLCLKDFGDGYVEPEKYNEVMGRCRIIVCPRGWGGQSQRHWDAWRSGKPVLTDEECASVEMIPGVVLMAGEHYLVYEKPEDIPDIVSDWSRPSRADDLARIAANARSAVEAYDPIGRLVKLFNALR